MMHRSFNISIFLITFNEENDLAKCLNSVAWSNDVVILDSLSTDRTKSIANSYPNTKFLERKFDGYSQQRNHGLHNISFQNEWVFILDADEVCTESLREDMFQKLKVVQDTTVLFCVQRDIFYSGKKLKWGSFKDVWIQRLVRPKKVSYYGSIHEKIQFQGEQEYLSERLEHYPFSKGIESWLARRNRYSSLQAEEELHSLQSIPWSNLLSKNLIERREALKIVYRKMPTRWVVFFCYNFFVKFCFLDGVQGLHVVLLETFYEFTIENKLYLMKKGQL